MSARECTGLTSTGWLDADESFSPLFMLLSWNWKNAGKDSINIKKGLLKPLCNMLDQVEFSQDFGVKHKERKGRLVS